MRSLPTLLRGKIDLIASWSEDCSWPRCAFFVACIVAGSGLYGAAMGWWRSPEQGFYAAIKLPLIMLLTVGGNALINGLLAPQLGLNISFRQSFFAILMSFTTTAAILGAFSPLIAFIVWNAPAMSLRGDSHCIHDGITLTHVAVIALAGIVGNGRLLQLLGRFGKSQSAARRVLLAWLATNLFLGSQLVWLLRPCIGSPHLPVQFIRPDAWHGNFYESVFHMFWNLSHNV